MITGVDVSGNNGAFKTDEAGAWQAVVNSGHSFAFVKASEGTGYRFARLARWAEMARESGLAVGSYHFAKPDAGAGDAEAEAKHYAACMAGVPLDLPPVLDLESTGLDARRTVDWALHFAHVIYAETGRLPMLYTYTAFWKGALGKTGDLTHLPLWQADYRTTPAVLAPWGTPAIWQYTGKGALMGFPGAIDLNRSDLTLDVLRAL